jgi:tetratricopeptide (TPR) repeat protein
MADNNIIRYTGGHLQKVRNQIAITNKLLLDNDEHLAKEYFNKGRDCCFKLKDYNESIKNYSKAIKLKPDYYQAYSQRGVAHFYLKDYYSAINDLTEFISLKPNIAGGYFERGNMRHFSKDFNGAIEDYNKAIEINPLYADAYYFRSLSKKAIGENESSFKDLNQAAKFGNKKAKEMINSL